MPVSELLRGFPPIVGPRPRILILGNMPSAMSLASNEYYGNPRNAFWRIIADIYDFDADAPYADRVTALGEHDVAVWDVLQSCRRVGSLDAHVQRDSMVPNDFAEFFNQHPAIDRIVFNGAAAQANYLRLVPDTLTIGQVRAPSTSPAHTMAYPNKLSAWRAALG